MDENWDTSGRRPEQFAPDSRRVAETAATQYPNCSGDPASCPENEGHGCCKANPEGPATTRQTNGVIGINVGSGPRYGKTLRAAIDSSMAAAKGEGA